MQKFIAFLAILCSFFINSNALGVDDTIEIDIYIKDHKFFPSVIEIPEGKKITITIHNQDSTVEEFESIELKREKIVLGNSKTRVILAPLRPGEYKFFGDFYQETAQGKIVVKEIAKEDLGDV